MSVEEPTVEELTQRIELLENALALVAWHATAYDGDDRICCTSCVAHDTKEDNCPVMAVVERTYCPFPDDEEGVDPKAPVVEALKRPMYISQLKVDVPSQIKPSYVHKAGTEFAPIQRVDDLHWEIELRGANEDGSFWYEKMPVHREQTEVVVRLEDPLE